MLLAIDTATRVMSIALYDGNTLRAEQSWLMPGNRHSIELAPAIHHMTRAAEVAMDDLTAVGVSIGPGSYTGLRIGVALAKGLAAARDLPLVGVTTLDTLAAGQPYYQSGSGLIAVVQAGRGRIIAKTYRRSKGRWSSRVEPRLLTWESLMETIDGTAHITGEVDEKGMAAIAAAQANEVPVMLAPPATRLRRAGFLAEDAWVQLENAEDRSVFSPDALLPVYIKSESEK